MLDEKHVWETDSLPAPVVGQPFHRDGKVDGCASSRTRTASVSARSVANNRDHTRRFRDLAAAVAKLSARTPLLDGASAGLFAR